jgi:phage gp36-like protein
MAYTDITKLIKDYGRDLLTQLTDRDNTGDIILEVIAEAVDDSDAEVDSYLKGRYPDDIPVANLPKNIKRIASDLTMYYLYKHASAIEIPDHIISSWKAATKDLEKIQSGKLTPFETVDEPAVFASNKTSSSKFFNSTVRDKFYDGY